MMTKEHLNTACSWIDNMLPDVYSTNIEDKLDVMTLKKMQLWHLD